MMAIITYWGTRKGVVLYGSGTWTVKQKDLAKLARNVTMMIRRMCNNTDGYEVF